MNQRTIPAGLLDDDIEFFNDPQDPEKCYCVTGGRVYRINDAPDDVKNLIDLDMALQPIKVEALVYLGYETIEEQREKYCSCCFGAFDGSPDVIDGVFIHNEYWPCPQRGICPVEGRLCDGLLVGNGEALTRREIDILILVGRSLLDKEIAYNLAISEQTVRVHLKHIREKSGCRDKKDMILLALKKNLL